MLMDNLSQLNTILFFKTVGETTVDWTIIFFLYHLIFIIHHKHKCILRQRNLPILSGYQLMDT